MKLLNKFANKIVKQLTKLDNVEDVQRISTLVAIIEEKLVTVGENVVKANLEQITKVAESFTEEDMQKAHDKLMKLLSYTPVWSVDEKGDLKVEATFEK